MMNMPNMYSRCHTQAGEHVKPIVKQLDNLSLNMHKAGMQGELIKYGINVSVTSKDHISVVGMQ